MDYSDVVCPIKNYFTVTKNVFKICDSIFVERAYSTVFHYSVLIKTFILQPVTLVFGTKVKGQEVWLLHCDTLSTR